MKKKWSSLIYIIIVAGLTFAIYWIIQKGKGLQTPELITKQAQTAKEATVANEFHVFKDSFSHGLTDPLAVLLLQIIVIIAFARLFGFLFKKIGQPAVIGEIVAGIVLGPSIVGAYFPEITQFLFPAASLSTLSFLSQIGLILFMFIIGMELDLKAIGKQAYGAVIISQSHPQSIGYNNACMADDNGTISLFAYCFQVKLHTDDEHKKYKTNLAEKTEC